MAVSIHELQACEALASSNLNNSLASTIFPRGRGATIVPARVTHLSGNPSREGAKGFLRTMSHGSRKSFSKRANVTQLTAIMRKLTCYHPCETSGKIRFHESPFANEVSSIIAEEIVMKIPRTSEHRFQLKINY